LRSPVDLLKSRRDINEKDSIRFKLNISSVYLHVERSGYIAYSLKLTFRGFYIATHSYLKYYFLEVLDVFEIFLEVPEVFDAFSEILLP